MFLRFETLKQKMIICKRIRMSYSENRTFELWSSFMPQRKLVTNVVSPDLYSIQVYDPSFDFRTFSPGMLFDKRAGMEVSSFEAVPSGMETFILPGGLYAVFNHTGTAADAPKTFGFIFGVWLPASGFEVDSRPHFEVLGAKYRRDDPSSEEEIWIPVKPR